MDWAATAAIAQVAAVVLGLLSLIALILVSPPIQGWIRRNESYNQLGSYDRDILKAIQDSQLGLGSIVLRMGDIEPLIELTSHPGMSMTRNRRLTVGQAFYQLSLESLESLGFLKEDISMSVQLELVQGLNKNYAGSEYRPYQLTGSGELFVRRYSEKLHRRPYQGRYVDLTSAEGHHQGTVRRRVRVHKEPPPYMEGPGIPNTARTCWITMLSTEKQNGNVECLAIIPRHNFGVTESDTVYVSSFFLHDSIPQFPQSDICSAKVISVQERGPIDNECLRVGEHTLMELGCLQPL